MVCAGCWFDGSILSQGLNSMVLSCCSKGRFRNNFNNLIREFVLITRFSDLGLVGKGSLSLIPR